MHFWIFCRKGAHFCRKSSGELQKPRIILQKTQNTRISADFLQKRACRPADFGSQRLRHSAENTEKRQKLQRSHFACRFQIRIAPRAFFGLQSPPRAGKPARRKSLWKSLSYPAARLRSSGATSTPSALTAATSCPSSQTLIYLVSAPCSAYRRHAAKYRASRTPSGVPSACQNGRRATAAGRS